MTRIRPAVRGLGVLALALPLSGAGLLLAAPAYATTGITAPGNGVDYASDTTVRITATLDKNSGSADLRLKSPAPGSTAETVDSKSSTLTAGASLAYNFDTATCASFPSGCSGRAEAPNGDWTVTLVGGGKTLDSTTFTLRIPPRTPTGFTARADGYRAVVLTWRKGDEPDLTGWTLYDGDGNVVQDGIGTDACSGTSCSTTVTYASDGTGQHTFALSSHRSVAPGSSDTLESGHSAPASATLDAPPPPPSPSPASNNGSGSAGGSTGGSSAGSTGGSPGGGTGGAPGGSAGGSTGGSAGGSAPGSAGSSPSGGTGTKSGSTSAIGTSKAPATVAQRRAFALTFKAFAPKLGIPKLPPLPATASPAVAPLPDGTYSKTLGYKDVVKTEKVDTPAAAARRVTGAVTSALDSGQFLRSIAGALILLLAAAHLRRWLGSAADR